MARGASTESLARSDRLVVVSAAAGLLALSWLILLRAEHTGGQPHDALLAPHAHGAGAAALLSGFCMWMVMMVAMMLPAVMPWILLFTRLSRGKEAGLFSAGYLVAWAGFSLAAALVQSGLQQSGLFDAAELRTGRLLGAIVLIAAGLFQISPLKATCLRHCRTPLAFFLARWRDGPAGALGMGLRHGLWCLACCWALMAVSFALGVMNLLWMAALTVFLCVEKVAPAGARLGRAAGVVLLVWGVWQIR